MAGRIRTIKPELLDDVRTAGLSDCAFRLFIGMILLSDDHGNLRAQVGYLHGACFWATPVPRSDVQIALDELTEAELIVPYEVRGQAYVCLAGWKKHQRVDHPGKPRVPMPDDPDAWQPVNPDNATVYFIQAADGAIKIGSSHNPTARMAALQGAHGSPLKMLATEPGGRARELQLHAVFRDFRRSGEWFSPSPEILDYLSRVSSRDPREGIASDAEKGREQAREPSRLTSDLRSPTTTSDHEVDQRAPRARAIPGPVDTGHDRTRAMRESLPPEQAGLDIADHLLAEIRVDAPTFAMSEPRNVAGHVAVAAVRGGGVTFGELREAATWAHRGNPRYWAARVLTMRELVRECPRLLIEAKARAPAAGGGQFKPTGTETYRDGEVKF